MNYKAVSKRSYDMFDSGHFAGLQDWYMGSIPSTFKSNITLSNKIFNMAFKLFFVKLILLKRLQSSLSSDVEILKNTTFD